MSTAQSGRLGEPEPAGGRRRRADPRRHAGSGGSILLPQKWTHDAAAWEALPVPEQEMVIGRSKADSIEMDPKPPESHIGRTDQDTFGNIFRRSMPYGTVTDHGTMFVGFSAGQRPLIAMLESMVGIPDGVRDALTRYTRPLSGRTTSCRRSTPCGASRPPR